MIPDRLDMATLQPVNALRAAGHDELGDPFGYRLALLSTHAYLSQKGARGRRPGVRRREA